MGRARSLRWIGGVATAVVLVAGIVGPAVPASAAASYFIDVRGSKLRVDGTFNPIVGHFSNLQYDDIYWYSPTGGDRLWSGGHHGATPDDVFTKPALAIDQGRGYSATVGDFAGDAKDDIVWRSATGPDQLWTSTGPHAFTVSTLPAAPDVEPVVLADSDGHRGKDDLLWRTGPTAAALWIFPDSGTGPLEAHAITVPQAEVVRSGDVDGNGVADLVFAGAQLQTWRRNSGTDTTFMASSRTGSAPSLVGRFGPAVDARDDLAIISASQVAPCEGCYAALGSMQILQSTTGGSYTSSNTNQRTTSLFQYRVEGTSRDLILANHFTVNLPGSAGTYATDTVWYQTASGPVARPTGVADLPEQPPIIGRFSTASRQDVFVYQPGTGTERLLVIR